MFRKILKRFGIGVTVLGLTCLSVTLSVLIAAGLTALGGGRQDVPGLLISILAPAIITPLLSWHSISLLARLDAAEQRLQLQSITDDLTQAYNRRYFVDYANREFQRARRSGGIFTIAILDLDNFKSVNDTHGHLTGDQVLINVCRICRTCVREADVFARFGGDEFVILLPETDRARAQILLERVLQCLHASRIVLPDGEVTLEMSIGAATLEVWMADVDDLLSQADQALYQAKRLGGSRYIFHQPAEASMR